MKKQNERSKEGRAFDSAANRSLTQTHKFAISEQQRTGVDDNTKTEEV